MAFLVPAYVQRTLWVVVGVTALSAATAGAAEADDRQRALAAAGAVKIVVRGQGWIRVSQPELRAAGLRADVDPATLQVFADGVEQAITVTGNGDAVFAGDEAIELWGVGRDTLSTDARTYWLVPGAAGARVPKLAPTAGAVAPASFTRTTRLAERKIYLSAIKNGEATNFFGAAVSATATTLKVAAPRVAAAQAATATLRVSLQGVTTGAHTVDVSLGGAIAGTCAFAEQEAKACAFPVTVGEGDNTVTLVARGGAKDFSALSSLELDYAHTFTAEDDALPFTAPPATRVSIAGFTSPDVRVVDVTDATHPTELTVTVEAQGATTAARIDTPAGAGPRSVFAFTPTRVGRAAAVVADAPSRWGDSHDGELVILSHAAFLDAMAPLVARRTQEGWSVQLVDLQDVYDERGGGDKSAAAVRAFLRDARDHWRVPPRYVIVVGDATFDPRNFLGKGDFDFAPTKLIDTAEMETVSDDWLVDFDDDGVPEIALGRFPVRTKEEAAIVVGKTLAYAGVADRARGGLFVTDTNGQDLDFETASAASETKVADLMPVDRFRRGEIGADPATLLAKLNQGPFLVNYMGHGSVEVWDGVLTSAQGKALTNTHASLYVVMNCLNAFFHDLYTESLGEALIKAPQGGAVAVWASSTLAEFGPQPAFNQQFLSRLSRTSLGQTAMAAKSSITDLEARRTWLLFGDPTLFGTPGPAPDGGVTDPLPTDGGVTDGAATPDGGAMEAGAADAQVPEPDASAPMADAGSRDAVSADAKGDATKIAQAGGGCGCRADGSTPASASAIGLLLLACSAAARRTTARRPRRGARRWPLALLALVLGGLVAPRAADAAYAYRKALTIDRTRIGAAGGATTLSNYPLLITTTDTVLRTTANGGHVSHASGYDITFTGADTTTCGGPSTCTFAYEIEKYVATTGEIVAWVRIPTLKTVTNTTNTVIYVQYGDATISAPTQNVNGTWDSSFKGVWHLNQSPAGGAPQMTESTSTAANATATNGPTAASAAKIGAGVTLDGTNDYFDYGTSTAFNYTAAETFTYSGWFLTADQNGPLHSLRGSVNGNPVIDIHIGYDGATSNPGKLMVLVRDDSSGSGFAEVVGGTVSDSAWHYYTVTRNAGTVTLYLDGTAQGNATGAGAAAAITTNLRHWGRDGNWIGAGYGTADQQYLGATLDELRVSKTIRSTDWIATDYSTQNAPASTFTASAEALASCGDGTKLMAEGCDDGNFTNGDGCTGTCTVETGYSCTGSPSVCTTTCSDGIVAGTEACDDGGTMNGDGCSSTCAVETAYSCSGSPSVCLFARFDYLKTITIDRTKVGGASAPTTLANYPVLVSITDPDLRTIANGGHVRNANGYDIVFRGLNTTTCGGGAFCTFPHEVEKYVATTGELIAWVNIASLNSQTHSTNTTFNVVYGNQAISTSTERRTATWNTNFKAVWHLNQNPGGSAPQMSDATSNANNGTSVSLTAVSAARVGAGVSTDGSTSSMQFNSGTSLDSAAGGAFTYSAWIKVPVAETLGAIVSSRSSTGGGGVVIDFMVGMNGPTTAAGKLITLVRDDTNGMQAEITGGTVNDDAWHLVTLTRSNTNIELFLDKVSQGTASGSGVASSFTTNLRDMGREGRWIQDNYTTPTTNAFLQATFDELRESNVARNIDWVTTDYNNQSAPSTFMTFGSETATNMYTAAMLASFDASETCGGTALRWQTTFEVDTLGFNVFREVGGVREQLNAALIPGSALSGGGARWYGLVDKGSFDPARTYWLEIVHFADDNTLHGPAVPQVGLACEGTTRPAPTPVASVSSPGAVGPSDPPALGASGCSLGGGGSNAFSGFAGLAALALLSRGRRRSR